MARRARPLGAADYAILGLLGEHPRHGYELAEAFRPSGDLAAVCGMPLNVLYAQVHRLEGFELIAGTAEPVGPNRERTVLHLTEAGRGAFREWLDRPVERMREIRQDFLLKLYFSQRDAGHDTPRLLDAQIERCQAYLAERVRERAKAPPDSFARLLGQVRVSAARGTLDWLKRYRRGVGAERGAGVDADDAP
ncbi:MAG TPA: PadR family transcriptional regulator [Chloroflexota bacterium]|jgi:PadR family transcriptional regulator AphA